MEVASISNKNANLISAYVNGTIDAKDISLAEAAIGEDRQLADFYERKLKERDFLRQLIPTPQSTMHSLRDLRQEITAVNEEIYPLKKLNIFQRIYRFLTKPVITIRY